MSTKFKPKHLVASYRWKPADKAMPTADETNTWFAVSTPSDKKFPRTLARWDGAGWMDINNKVLPVVTFFAYLPHTPEDLRLDDEPEPIAEPIAIEPAVPPPAELALKP